MIEKYRPLFLEALAIPATVGKRVNVLQHIIGYFRGQLGERERKAIAECLEEYRQGESTFLAALTAIRVAVKKIDEPYLEEQLFFDPYPKQLGLRKYL